jgi:hypothetical protein
MTLRLFRFVEEDPARRVKRVVTTRLQVVEQLLNSRLVRHGGPGILLAPVPLGGILAVVAVHLIEPLGLRVVRLEVVVRERPRGRQTVDMSQVAEVLGRNRYSAAP